MGSPSETHSLSALGGERRQTGSELPLLPRPPSKVYVFGYGRVGTGGVQEMTATSSTAPLFFETGLSVNLRHAISPRLPCQEIPGSFCLCPPAVVRDMHPTPSLSLVSRDLHCNHLTHGAISPGPLRCFWLLLKSQMDKEDIRDAKTQLGISSFP